MTLKTQVAHASSSADAATNIELTISLPAFAVFHAFTAVQGVAASVTNASAVTVKVLPRVLIIHYTKRV